MIHDPKVERRKFRAAGPSSIAALALAAASLALPAETLKERAARIQRTAIVVDTHEDVPEELQKHCIDLGVRNGSGQVDIPRLREGGVTASFFAAYVPAAFVAALEG